MIEQAFIIAFIVQAVNACFSEGMIFGRAGTWLETNYHSLWKPLVGCPTCMSFWYGLIFILLSGGLFLAVPVSMGISWVIGKLDRDE